MLKPYQMSSVIVTGPNTVQETVIKELHSLKILHIVDHSKNEMADIGKPLESAGHLSELLVKVRALMAALEIRKEKVEFELKRGLLEIDSTVKKVSHEVNTAVEELRMAEERLSKNELVKGELEILKGINVPLEAFSNYNSLAYFTGYVKNNNSASLIKVELSITTQNFLLFSCIHKKKPFIALFIDAKSKDIISYILEKHGFTHLSFDHIANFKGTAASNIEKIESETAKLHRKRDEIKKRLSNFCVEYRDFLLASEEFLNEQIEKAEAPLKFASTQSTFLIKGWIPSDDLTNTINRLNKATKNRIYIYFEPPKKTDKVPVKLKNPKYARPFESLIDLYSVPAYKEIDPTFFIFLTFPIFFGIMLGDVGYGAMSLVLFWILKKKMPYAKNFLNVLMLASCITILFGFLFGEFFGYEFIHPIISREHEMFKLLYMAIAIGVVHVNIGLILGFINELKYHGVMHAIYSKASWIILQLGITMLVLHYFGFASISPLIGAVFLGASILMLLKGEGIKGLIELPSILTNIISYARLMAIGLSSVSLAVVINESAKEFFHKGGLFVLIGVLILLIGHIINIVLGLLASFLHSLRLHYVEFFSKFFHGGAKKYQPFGAKE